MMAALLDLLRLDLALEQAPNLLANHSGQNGLGSGTAAWSAEASGGTIAVDTGQTYGWNGTSLRRADVGNYASLKTPRVSTAGAGTYVNAATTVRLLSTGTYTGPVYATLSVQLIRSDGVEMLNLDLNKRVPLVLGQDVRVIGEPLKINPDSDFGGPLTYLTVRLGVYAQTIGTGGISNPNPTTNSVSWAAFETVLGNNAEAAKIATLPFVGGAPVNILGNGLNLTARRGLTRAGVSDTLEPGELTATVRDVAGDVTPEVNRYTRPGALVALRVLSAGAWRDLVTAHISKGAATQAGTKTDPRTNVTLTALDAVTALANTDKPQATAGTTEQRLAQVLAGTNRRGATHQALPAPAAAPTAITKPETIKALEQLTRLRDTIHGYAWVDAANVVQVRDAAHAPATAPAFTLSDVAGSALSYTDIDLDYGTDALVNTLTLTRVNFDEVTPTDDAGSKEYGPYTSRNSVAEWGTFADEVTVVEGTPVDHAAYFLADQTEPRSRVRSLRVRVHAEDAPATAQLLALALAELYTCLRIQHGTHNALYRLIGVEHTITATRWDLELTVRPLEVTGSVVDLGTPAAGANTGPVDLNPPVLTTHAARHRSTVLSIATGATATTIAFDAFAAEDTALAYDATNRWFTVTKAGLYTITAVANFAANATGYRRLDLAVDGVIRRGILLPAAATASGVGLSVALTTRLTAGQKLTALVTQTSGAALNLLGGRELTAIDVTYLGP